MTDTCIMIDNENALRSLERTQTMIDLKNRDFLKLLDFTPEEIFGLIDLAADLK